MSHKNRRKWTPEQKLKIVLESMQSDRKPAEVCRRHGVAGPRLLSSSHLGYGTTMMRRLG